MNAEQKFLFDKLTQLQQRVSTNVLAGMSQRQAYYEAGGSAKNDVSADSTVYELLSNPQVVAFMDSMKVQAVNKAIMDRDEMLARLSLFARFGVSDLAEFKSVEAGRDLETGAPVMQTVWHIPDSILQDREKLSIISELSAGKDGIKFKAQSSIQAMALLAKMQGYEAASKHEHTGANGGPILTRDVSEMSDEELAAHLGDDN